MKGGKQAYMMYKSWNPVIRSLPEPAAGKLFHAITAYQDGEQTEIKDDPMLNAILQMMIHTFEIDAEKYAAIVERNRQNGRKGGRPPKEQRDDPEEEEPGREAFSSFWN